MTLILRPLLPTDEAAARAAHDELHAEGFEFLFGLSDDLSWADYLVQLQNSADGVDLPAHIVANSFYGAFVGDTLVGRLSLRHSLNDYLRQFGGHLGYAVRPAYRQRGHATAILRSGLAIAADLGLGSVLLTCDDDNLASAAVIVACGGEFDSYVTDPKSAKLRRRYWIRGL